MSRQVTRQETIRLVPSTYAVSSTSSLSVSNASNAYTNTDSTTYTTITNTYASTSSRYYYLRGFNFDDIPSGATINSFTVKIKGYEGGLTTNTSYAPRLANGTSAIPNTTATTNFGTSTKTITIPTGPLTWQQIVNYGSNFTIVVYVRRSNKNNTGYFYCYGAEIEVNYTISGTEYELGITNNSSTTTVSPSTTQYVFQGGSQVFTITTSDINSISVTDNNVDVTSQLVPTSPNYTYTISNISADHSIVIADLSGYNITCTDNSTFGNITPTGTQNVEEGDDVVYTLTASDFSLIKLTDNNVDVTSQIVHSQGSGSGSPVFVPSSYSYAKPEGEQGVAIDEIQNGSNAYTDTSSTTYATLWCYVNNYNWAVYYISVSGIPEGATIDSVTCKVKIKQTLTGTGTRNTIQLYSGNTAKGTPTSLTYNQTFNDYLNIGTWTAEELQDVRLYICEHATTGASQGLAAANFFGAELTVTYHSIAGDTYTISNVSAPHNLVLSDQPYCVLTCTDNSTNGDIAPTGTRNVVEGGTAVYTLTSSDFSKLKLTDNGVDVTNQIVYSSTTSSGSPMFVPSGFEIGTFTEATDLNNAYSDASDYISATLKSPTISPSNSCSCAFTISVTGIPSGAIIDSVSCKARLYKYLTDQWGSVTIQLYSGNMPKGTATSITGSNQYNTKNLDTGTWTVEELQNVRLVITFTASITSNSQTISFAGAEFMVTYHSTQGYTYNILNASIPHTLELIDFDEALHMKINGNWVRIAKVYKKVNNVWTEVSLDSLTDPGIYIKK